MTIELEYKEDHSPLTSFQHHHPNYELGFFLKANMKVFIKDMSYDIHDGDLLFIGAYDVHRIVYNEGSYLRFVLFFNKADIQEVLEALDLSNFLKELELASHHTRKVSLSLAQQAEFDRMYRLLHQQLHEKKSAETNTLSGIKIAMIQLLLKFRNLMDTSSAERKKGLKVQHIKNIVTYIDQHYSQPISLVQLASRFHLNKYYISHSFKEITQFTVTEYIHYRRVIEAQKCLLETTKPQIDICYECGFGSIQHFHNIFKRISGLTPSNFRKKG